jgi:prepilin-type N-terminal cleavage/methylation domain-containing protein
MKLMSRLKKENSRGFTILELLIAMALFLVISGSVLGGMAKLQSNTRTGEVNAALQQQLRSTMELMAQEIGQAGLQASTVDGAATDGIAGATSPYKISAVSAGTNQTFTMTTSGSAVFAPYVGQWLNVDGGTNQDPIQLSQITPTIQATFGMAHATNTSAYPMGVFPHGILTDKSVSAVAGSKLAMFGEINGSGNGLWAVEYSCPSTFPGSLTRTAWNLSNSPLTATQSNLIDNVTQCYFCWQDTPGSGSPGTGNPNCPALAAAPDKVNLPVPAAYTGCPAGSPAGACTYAMITQVGFTITASQTVTISGSTQPITITKSYSNMQPRNIITADNIYKSAVTAANNAVPVGNYATYIFGELQPDPPALASVPW